MEFDQQIDKLSIGQITHISWISEFLRRASVLLELNPFLANIVCFGIVPLMLALFIILLSAYHPTILKMLTGVIPFRFTIPALLAYSWIILGPRLIYKFEVDLLPLFLWKAKRFVLWDDYIQLVKVSSRFPNLQRHWGPFVFLMTLFMGWLMYPYAKIHFYVPSIAHPFYILSRSSTVGN